MSRKICHFHNQPGGCRRGSQCQFSHEDARPVSSSSPRDGASNIGMQSTPPQPPAGVCSFFWTSGKCKREFDCRYRHTQNPTSRRSTVISSRSSSQAIEAIAPFLTKAGLAKVTGTGTDAFFSNPGSALDPTEAHNHLKNFLYDNYRFNKTFQIYAFLKVISSANSSNAKWTTEDGQLFLSAIANGNGLLRIGDIIRWSPVSVKAGSNPMILSFQRGYLPLLRFYSSDFVVKSTLSHLINSLYLQIMNNFSSFSDTIEDCMTHIMVAKSFKDPGDMSSSSEPLGSQVIASLAVIFFECITRFKNALVIYPGLAPLVKNLQGWMKAWTEGISASTFNDPFKNASPAARDHIIDHLNGKITRIIAIIDREEAKVTRSQGQGRSAASLSLIAKGSDEGIIAMLHTSYEGPGELRPDGPRHDNDHVDIGEIRIAPTHEELVSRIPPFLPANLYNAPHPAPAESPERLLDIQFRLLREELTAPLRSSIQLVREDMKASPRTKTRLSDILVKCGGKYRSFADAQDSVMFNVYTNVEFSSLYPDRRGLSVGLSIDAPPGRARSEQARARASFWEGASGKRLMQGGLIALVWNTGAEVEVHLGTLASSLQDLTDSAKKSASRVSVRVLFFDSDVELRILNAIKRPDEQREGTKVLVEAPVMFEAIRPFLEALRVEPESIPFNRYLVHRPPGFFDSVTISAPKYALTPGFTFQIASLFPPDAGVQDLELLVSDPGSIATARQELRRSRLDPSQADAIVDALTRELTLIQGPPGTGKSFTGVELIRVLLANKVGPILMIAFTNHALDHILSSVLDADITSKMVRLGSRSADERISKFSIETLELVAGKSRLDRTFGRHHRNLKLIEEEILTLMKQFHKTTVASEDIVKYIEIQYSEHFEHLIDPPGWISILIPHSSPFTPDDGGGWQRAGKKGRAEEEDRSPYAYWRTGQDLDFIQATLHQISSLSRAASNVPTQPSTNQFAAIAEPEADSDTDSDLTELDSEDNESDDEFMVQEKWQEVWDVPSNEVILIPPLTQTDSLSLASPAPDPKPLNSALDPDDFKNPQDFFWENGYKQVPSIPSSNRPLGTLLEEGALWSLSRSERNQLHSYWTEQVRIHSHEDQLQDFERLRRKHQEALEVYNEGRNEARRQLLQNIDIVGCTTTGAAKLTSLLKGIAPRVMLVEEAGQVLEAHVLGSLVPSVEHLILIGDPLQLRPTLNNYALSVENNRGGQLFKFDMSLMERLAKGGLPMSRIDVQRRMRPSISSLIRNTLYPGLQDHALVKSYQPVRGFAKNIYFLSHNHKENGGVDESTSKYNIFEADMIKDMVLYLLRQGCYSQEGDIVVLCAYLGQLARVRDALSSEVAVVIDDRDQMELADREDEKDENPHSAVEHVKVSKRVRIRTVDNYQGEEAKIVILSLVRNGGTSDDDAVSSGQRGGIGFLKSDNRTNVALSRAREGLFILGNSSQMASRSRMWRSVIEELEQDGAVGDALPVACHLHPDAIEYVSKPGKLPLLAPDGGCLRPCDSRLKCGHLCPYKCHPDDPGHLGVTCFQPCPRLCGIRGHPCSKQCSDPCGECRFPVANVELPCGHTKPTVLCYSMDDLSEVHCDAIVNRKLPGCEHGANMICSMDPAQYTCKKLCGGVMTCCGRDCNSRCYQCQGKNAAVGDNQVIKRINHFEHSCQSTLYCGHSCRNLCSLEHEHTTTCKEACRQECVHARCKNYCSTPCAPCKESCAWTCPHYTCAVPCGSVCARLPCDQRCSKLLPCNHRCSSVCGEDCSIQTCPICAPPEIRENIVDLLMQRSLGEISSDQDTLDELLITLPKCRHVFTVETLDGICSMNDYYIREGTDDQWLGLKAPPASIQNPVCPTCRALITSPRYGRVFKRADLDILEKNVASNMSRSLAKVHTQLGSISRPNIETLLIREASSVKTTPIPCNAKQGKSRVKARKKVLKEARYLPAQPDVLNPGNDKLFNISLSAISAWQKVTRPLMQAYHETCVIAAKRSAHTDAWEAAFSYLYEQEMERASSDPARAPRQPREYAMRFARMMVGHPQPRADKRFLVEAIWATVDIRFMLAGLAQAWLKAADSNQSYSREEKQNWATYGLFLLESCCQDVQIAFDIAKESHSRRQMTKTSRLIMRADFERFRYNVYVSQQSGVLKSAENRQKLADTARQMAKNAEDLMISTLRDHRAVERPPPQQAFEESWLNENFISNAKKIKDEWESILRTILLDTFYEPVSLEEKMDIVKAFNFSHTGHFYTCPNGHPFVIGECGGATQRAFCPECGSAIGGEGHRLENTNSRAMEFEDIARGQGAARSPWTWGV